VLLAYAKIWLYQKLLDSSLPDDPSLQGELRRYFPETLRKKYENDILKHQLRREIIATVVTNSIGNRAGTAFMLTMAERTGRDIVAVTRAYIVASEVFASRPLLTEIESLDNRVPAKAQTDMLLTIRAALNAAVYWFLTEIDVPTGLAPVIAAYSEGVKQLSEWLAKADPASSDDRVARRATDWAAQDVPAALARRVASLPALVPALDLTRLAQQSGGNLFDVADVFFGLDKRLGLDWLTRQAHTSSAQTPWQREAVFAALAELAAIHRRLVAAIIGSGKNKKRATPQERLERWLERNAAKLDSYDAQLQEWRGVGNVDLAMLTLAARRVEEM
jgi:glutamate dehydrogenase